MSIESVTPSNHLILSYPLLLLPFIFLSIRIFSDESVLRIRWSKYWSFSYSISPSSEYSGWNIQSILKEGLVGSACSPSDSQESSSTPQFKSINSLALSFLYSPTVTTMTTGKTIALSRWTFVGKVMFLLFNKLSRLVIACLPRSKCLLISWLQSPSAVILKPPKIKSITVSILSPSICHEVMIPAKVCLVKAMVFSVVMYGCESWTVKKAEHRRTDAFEL